MQPWFGIEGSKISRFLRASHELWSYAKDHRSVRVAHIPFGALRAVLARGFLQLISLMNISILGHAAAGAPTSMSKTMLKGKIQRGAISACLPSGNQLNNVTQGSQVK